MGGLTMNLSVLARRADAFIARHNISWELALAALAVVYVARRSMRCGGGS